MNAIHYIEKLRGRAEDAIMSLPALMLKSEKIADNILHGEHGKRKSGTGDEFWQFREYHNTDRPEDIDWRQSAKGDQVFTKQTEWHVTRKIFFWCAGGETMNFSSDKTILKKQESAQILCLSLALLLRKNHEQIGIYGQRRTGRSEKAVENIAQHLFARNTTNEVLPETTALTHPQHAIFIGVGDFLSPIEDIERHFAELSKQTQNALIIQTIDPAELELSYTGRVRFNEANTYAANSEVINNVKSIREAYKQRISAHIASVKSLCAENNWHYVFHRTNEDITDTLKAIWETVDIGGVRK